MRITLREWAENNYSPGSRPCAVTLRSMAAAGEIPGAFKQRGRWWVNCTGQTHQMVQDQITALVGDDPVLKKAIGQ